jgi:hypothetical protein
MCNDTFISLPSGPTISPDVQALSANKQNKHNLTLGRASSTRRAQWGEAAEKLLIAAAKKRRLGPA